jgi:hypothetical protein
VKKSDSPRDKIKLRTYEIRVKAAGETMPSARKLKINLWKEELKAIAFVSVSFSNS